MKAPAMHTYFAYGSNLSRTQMRARCPGARVLGPAALAGYRLAFAGSSQRWDGGAVATLLPARGALVRGLLYAIDDAAVAALDRFEGHPHVYLRVRVAVRDEAGRRRSALAYCLRPDEEAMPAKRYLQRIVRAYERLGFDLQPLVDAVRRAA